MPRPPQDELAGRIDDLAADFDVFARYSDEGDAARFKTFAQFVRSASLPDLTYGLPCLVAILDRHPSSSVPTATIQANIWSEAKALGATLGRPFPTPSFEANNSTDADFDWCLRLADRCGEILRPYAMRNVGEQLLVGWSDGAERENRPSRVDLDKFISQPLTRAEYYLRLEYREIAARDEHEDEALQGTNVLSELRPLLRATLDLLKIAAGERLSSESVLLCAMCGRLGDGLAAIACHVRRESTARRAMASAARGFRYLGWMGIFLAEGFTGSTMRPGIGWIPVTD